MAGPKPDDPYNPVPTAAPNTQAPNDYLQVRATPDAFGAQVGAGMTALGSAFQGAGKDAAEVALQKQGMANEHAGMQAGLLLDVENGKTTDEFKQNQGLQAENTKDSYIQKLQDNYNKIRSTLNPSAARSYDADSMRRLGYAISDFNSYATTERTKAYRQGYAASIKSTTESLAKYTVASDPMKVGASIGSALHDLNGLFTAPDGVGKYSGLYVTQSPTGELQFDTNTPAGKLAQADYDAQVRAVKTDLYTTAFDTLWHDTSTDENGALNGSIGKAMKFLNDNKDDIPSVTFRELQKQGYGPFMTQQAWDAGKHVFDSYGQKFQNGDTSTGEPSQVYSNNAGNVKLANSQYANPATPTDGVILTANNLRSNLYKGLTLSQIAAKWTGEDPKKVADWLHNVTVTSGLQPGEVPNLNDPTVMAKLVHGITVAEKSPADQGLFTPDVITKGVTAALAGGKANLQSSNHELSTQQYLKESDYYNLNRGQIASDALAYAQQHFPDNTQIQEEVVNHALALVNQKTSADAALDRANKDTVWQAISDPRNNIQNTYQLDHWPDQKSQVAQAWNNLSFYDKQNVMQRLLTAKARQDAPGYGADFYNIQQKVLTGQVKDFGQIAGSLGDADKSNGLTMSGAIELQKRIAKIQNDPTGKEASFARQESEFINNLHSQATASKMGIHSPELEAWFNHSLEVLLPQIEAGRAKGLSPGQMFNPDSKDYLGHNVVLPTEAEIIKFTTSQALAGANQSESKTVHLGTIPDGDKGREAGLAELQARRKNKQVTRQQAIDYALKRKWVEPDAPPVPMAQ